MTNLEIKELLLELGSNVPEDFVWSNELRSKFERALKTLEKKVTNNSKTRVQLSNPNVGISHEELLKKAGVKTFTEYEIEDLGNGRIKVNPKN